MLLLLLFFFSFLSVLHFPRLRFSRLLTFYGSRGLRLSGIWPSRDLLQSGDRYEIFTFEGCTSRFIKRNFEQLWPSKFKSGSISRHFLLQVWIRVLCWKVSTTFQRSLRDYFCLLEIYHQRLFSRTITMVSK